MSSISTMPRRFQASIIREAAYYCDVMMVDDLQSLIPGNEALKAFIDHLANYKRWLFNPHILNRELHTMREFLGVSFPIGFNQPQEFSLQKSSKPPKPSNHLAVQLCGVIASYKLLDVLIAKNSFASARSAPIVTPTPWPVGWENLGGMADLADWPRVIVKLKLAYDSSSRHTWSASSKEPSQNIVAYLSKVSERTDICRVETNILVAALNLSYVLRGKHLNSGDNEPPVLTSAFHLDTMAASGKGEELETLRILEGIIKGLSANSSDRPFKLRAPLHVCIMLTPILLGHLRFNFGRSYNRYILYMMSKALGNDKPLLLKLTELAFWTVISDVATGILPPSEALDMLMKKLPMKQIFDLPDNDPARFFFREVQNSDSSENLPSASSISFPLPAIAAIPSTPRVLRDDPSSSAQFRFMDLYSLFCRNRDMEDAAQLTHILSSPSAWNPSFMSPTVAAAPSSLHVLTNDPSTFQSRFMDHISSFSRNTAIEENAQLTHDLSSDKSAQMACAFAASSRPPSLIRSVPSLLRSQPLETHKPIAETKVTAVEEAEPMDVDDDFSLHLRNDRMLAPDHKGLNLSPDFSLHSLPGYSEPLHPFQYQDNSEYSDVQEFNESLLVNYPNNILGGQTQSDNHTRAEAAKILERPPQVGERGNSYPSSKQNVDAGGEIFDPSMWVDDWFNDVGWSLMDCSSGQLTDQSLLGIRGENPSIDESANAAYSINQTENVQAIDNLGIAPQLTESWIQVGDTSSDDADISSTIFNKQGSLTSSMTNDKSPNIGKFKARTLQEVLQASFNANEKMTEEIEGSSNDASYDYEEEMGVQDPPIGHPSFQHSSASPLLSERESADEEIRMTGAGSLADISNKYGRDKSSPEGSDGASTPVVNSYPTDAEDHSDASSSNEGSSDGEVTKNQSTSANSLLKGPEGKDTVMSVNAMGSLVEEREEGYRSPGSSSEGPRDEPESEEESGLPLKRKHSSPGSRSNPIDIDLLTSLDQPVPVFDFVSQKDFEKLDLSSMPPCRPFPVSANTRGFDADGQEHIFDLDAHQKDYEERIVEFLDVAKESYIDNRPPHIADPSKSIFRIMTREERERHSVSEMQNILRRKVVVETGGPPSKMDFDLETFNSFKSLNSLVSIQGN
ncbi:hypothetical protein CVT24_002675 [Panaeolus cyanescens]|uniref:Uncharacterized protein n=1 Tax=Panaeolus cyanescens TaxID=181874 RepID=A0A409YY84_9AGAR|nr:hypothetical protein CVT24_002675 [Panaeolus cyanescens]